MDHLNIVKVLDACTTATNRPYFVMGNAHYSQGSAQRGLWKCILLTILPLEQRGEGQETLPSKPG